MNIMEIEKQLLLEQHGSSEVEVDHYVEAEHHASRWPLHVLQIHTKRSSWFRNGWPFTIIIISLVFTAGLIIGIAVAPVNHPPHSISFSPAQSAVRYEQQSTHPTDHHLYSSYSGPPTDQQTKAWERLLEPVMIGVSYKEMALADEDPDSSIQLSSGGYLASLSVYHDLHCLRRIRFFIYQDYYYPNITTQERIYEKGHIDHCLESLRLSIMCSGEIGLYTFTWKPNVTKAATKSNFARQCVNWNALEGWTRGRSVGIDPLLKPRPDSLKARQEDD